VGALSIAAEDGRHTRKRYTTVSDGTIVSQVMYAATVAENCVRAHS
jgi:hypothetical protein